ncbi:MAG: EAL domain-containing protein [Marinobacter sp.]|uniref:bifunctional diguanylate cyclase/phosphodiesterase n=1 Tax=Marinobacter sp. TaxID=50741 RepID=UPI00299D081B|nr:EAL domain-containing protein [Marinobacter sp.]MDX1633337.1 EAL domain-containing protein [Marinobacter sp.]
MRADRNSDPTRKISLRALLLGYTGALVLLLLLVSVSVSFDRFRDYIADQLRAHAQDAATAVGLSLSNAIDGRDPVAAATLIDATFDSGRYLRIQYHDITGDLVVQRTASLDDLPVPGWFRSLASLPITSQRAEVVRGWQRLGVVTVTSDPGRAYRDLWRISWAIVTGSMLIGGVALLVLYLLLTRLLRPLRDLEGQAEAMGRRDFRRRVAPGATRELSRVAGAMNQMADDLGQLFEGQAKLIQHLRRLNNEDSVTGLVSRRAFDQRVKVAVESREAEATGVLMLIQFAGFQEFNRRAGREQADQVLIRLAERLNEFALNHARAFAGRRAGAEFAVFLPGVAMADAMPWARELVANLDGDYADLIEPLQAAVHAGLAQAATGLDARSLLAAADQALRQAQMSETSSCREADQDAGGRAGADRWRRELTAALANRQVQIWLQPVVAPADEAELAGQVTSRLLIEGDWRRGGVFAPWAERFGLMPRLDLIVIELVLAALVRRPDERLVMTLGNSSVADPDFHAAFISRLAEAGPVSRRLTIGIQEHAVHHHHDSARRLVDQLRRQRVEVLVDGFGVGGVPFSYLRNLPFQALRIDQSFVHDLPRHDDNRFYLESIVAIARSRGVRVFVSGVETAAEWQLLRTLGIDGAAGYHLGRPEPLAGDHGPL